jgi:hypothetical protein
MSFADFETAIPIICNLAAVAQWSISPQMKVYVPLFTGSAAAI